MTGWTRETGDGYPSWVSPSGRVRLQDTRQRVACRFQVLALVDARWLDVGDFPSKRLAARLARATELYLGGGQR